MNAIESRGLKMITEILDVYKFTQFQKYESFILLFNGYISPALCLQYLCYLFTNIYWALTELNKYFSRVWVGQETKGEECSLELKVSMG
jgi:hypothetical protein